MRQSAEVELWVCVQQHRYRYSRLRTAVRLLRYAALATFVLLAVALAVG
jgi:hypothetical protein